MSENDKIKAARLDTDETTDRSKATGIIHSAVLQLLGMFYNEEGIDDGVIMSAVFQVCGTLAASSMKNGSGYVTQDWHDALDKAIEIADLNAAGPPAGGMMS